MTQHRDNETEANFPAQNQSPTHQHNKTKNRPPLNKTSRRTKAETENLMRACWNNHINAQHHEVITNQHRISFGYYYKLIQRASKEMIKQYGEDIQATTMRVIDQYLRNYRLSMQHYAKAIQKQKEAEEQNDSPEYHREENHAKDWLGKAKENQDALAQFLIRTGLIKSEPEQALTINNITAFQEVIKELNNENASVTFGSKPS